MPEKKQSEDNCRLRVDPALVDKFRRLQGGINEVGTKIIRDLGLRYVYDKQQQTFDLIGPDTEILGLSIETLRFWVEDDDFPNTGITCQVGYPNRRMIVWRFHGDYAKKFDHLFADDIARLKLVISVNIKAVPNKQNPVYIELYCHFSVYHQVKHDVAKLTYQLGKIYQDDFFIPKSDFVKARDFAKSKRNDKNVLYALKEYPDNKVRVWLFARDQIDIIRARKEWISHVGIIALDNEFTETVKTEGSVRSASFFGHPASALGSETSEHFPNVETSKDILNKVKEKEASGHAMSHTLSQILSRGKPKPRKSKKVSPRTVSTTYDNSNFPRPSDFVYPVNYLDQLEENEDNHTSDNKSSQNPFDQDIGEAGDGQQDSLGGVARWVRDDGTNTERSIHSYPYSNNRIYIHHNVSSRSQYDTVHIEPSAETTVVHPETNLIVSERYNPTNPSKAVLTNTNNKKATHGRTIKPKLGHGNKSKANKVKETIKQKRPSVQPNKHTSTVRYNININGLDVYMYKQDITKVTGVDAIGNVVVSSLTTGGLVAISVFTAAGKQVTDELNVHVSLYGEPATSDSVVTSAGRLPVLGIVHVVSPIWKEYTVWENCASDLHKTIYNALKTAENHKYRKIALPTIGSEPFFGIPKDLVADVYVKALVDYSMTMGPMYPVLEVHLVDLDVKMLKYIKDAYESWVSTQNIENANQHLNKDSASAMRNHKDMSQRSESVVNIKSLPSHRSENMVTFSGQSYTKEGEQIWTFEVLQKLVVHVYTGSILKLKDIDAIVCAVDVNFKGTLAKQVQMLGGKQYAASMKKTRGTRTLVEGDVLICDAGDLGMRSVIHSVIVTPIHVVNQKNISRLDNINTQVFYAANQNGIKSLAMPLIGAGRLRERIEVEQCSLQLIDNIIEMCLGIGKDLQLKELHLVNTNHVMTQYLTQALRTRSHTKLRVEIEPNVPSRQEVLIKSETNKANPELQRRPSAMSSVNKPMIGEANHQDELKAGGETVEGVFNQHKFVIAEDKTSTNKHDNKVHNDGGNDAHAVTKINDKHKDKKKMPYLSTKTLQQHDRNIQDAWLYRKNGGVNKELHGNKQTTTARTDQQCHTNKDQVVKKAHEFLKESKIGKTKRPPRRIIQRSSDYILQKSQTDTYKTLFDKKRRYSELSQREEMIKLRKSQSSDDIWKNGKVGGVLSPLNEHTHNMAERNFIFDENHQVDKLDLAFDYSNNAANDFQQNHLGEVNEKFKTFEEYHMNVQHTGHTESEQTGKGYKTHRNVGNKTSRKGNQTHRLIHSKSEPPVQRHVSPVSSRKKERYLIDPEREDLYMMDMDYLAREREKMEIKKEHNKLPVEDTPALTHRSSHDPFSMTQTEQLVHEQEETSYAPNDKSGMSETMPEHDSFNYQTMIEGENEGNIEKDLADDNEPNDIDAGKIHSQMVEDAVDITQTKTDISKQSRVDTKLVEVKDEIHREEVTPPKLDGKREVHRDANVHDTKNKTDKRNKLMKSSKSSAYKNKPSVTFSDVHHSKQRNESGRAEYAQAYSNTPRRNPEPTEQKKTVEWKNETKMTRAALDRFNQRRRQAVRAPKPEEVTIRDKLKLQIEIVDKMPDVKVENNAEIEKEKRKIKRFWEVVGKDDINEAEMFGQGTNTNENEKMLIAKVTKERVMPAKTSASRQSKHSVITHSVGNYNLTLAVADS